MATNSPLELLGPTQARLLRLVLEACRGPITEAEFTEMIVCLDDTIRLRHADENGPGRLLPWPQGDSA